MIQSEKLSYTEYALRLDRQITAKDTLKWWEVNPAVWVDESSSIRDSIYPSDRESDELPNLSWSYKYKHLGTAERRLQQAGVRLAAYLDWVFADTK